MKLALYARVSTTDQTCAIQLRELRAYAAARGWYTYTEYVDTGWSGAKASRPQLDRLMADARSRKVDTILVWKLDRWGRSLAHCVSSVRELQGLGVRWIAVTQNLDTSEDNPMSRFMLHIMAAFAELERELIRERVLAGVANAKAEGRVLGRPAAVFDRTVAREMRASGLSIRQIADELGQSKSVVARALR